MFQPPQIVRQGAAEPENMQVMVPTEASVDLTTASAAELHVKMPSGIAITWDATIVSATTEMAIVQHDFVDGDLPEIGRYAIIAHLTVPAGIVRGVPFDLIVLDEFAVV